jgi:hypothetical protein
MDKEVEKDKEVNKDNKSSNIKTSVKTLLRLFPYLQDKSKAINLKIDRESLHYISIREHAEKISLIIKNHLLKLKIEPIEAIITDSTACVGGDTISFALSRFKKVYAIELDKERSELLQNNIDVYSLNDIVEVINNNMLDTINRLDSNVIYIDPPWGGKNYKNSDNLKLSMSDVPLETICNNCFDNKIMSKPSDLVVLKLPTNYDIKHLYKEIISNEIYFYDLKKMYILVIVNPKIHF